MYAVIAHGGKQYRVAPGDVVRLERMAGTAGQSMELGKVLLVENAGEVRVGAAAASSRVTGTLLRQDRNPKVLIFKKKRCKQYRRTQGHRQYVSEIRIDRID